MHTSRSFLTLPIAVFGTQLQTMMLKQLLVVLFIALCKTELSQALCKRRDIVVVVELAAADKLSAYYSTLFMDKLKNRLRAGNECMKLGFVFCWKKAESVINLKCNYKSCYAKGWSTARAIVQKSVRLRVAFDKEEFFKGMRMAAKELLPGGKDSTNQREKVMVLILSKPPNKETIDIATRYLNSNIRIIAIAVGDGVEKNLGAVSSAPKYMLQLTRFKDLNATAATQIGNLIAPASDIGCDCSKQPVEKKVSYYMNQGQKVIQTGRGSYAGVIGQSGRFHNKNNAKKLSNREVIAFIRHVLPYYHSMSSGLKKLISLAVKHKRRGSTYKK